MNVTFPRRSDYKTRAEIDALIAQVYANYPDNRQGRRAAHRACIRRGLVSA
jgi:hypothetical protein